VDENEANRKVGALKAIIQTLLLEHYWEMDEESGKQRFLGMAEADHLVAMAILNELTQEELAAAFRWPGGEDGDRARGLPALPVIAFLTEAQYERARVTTLAEDEGDRARSLAMEEWERSGAKAQGESELLILAEERFVSAMVKDLVARRGEDAAALEEGALEERIASMHEPWGSRTRRELERLREDLALMLEESARSESRRGAGI